MSVYLINRFGRNVSRIVKNANPTFVDGYAVEAATTTTTFKASVQPLTPDDLEMLPEGSDSSESLKLYTLTKLNKREGNPPKSGDIVDVDGRKYEVVSRKDYVSHQSPANSITFYKVIILKVSYDNT